MFKRSKVDEDDEVFELLQTLSSKGNGVVEVADVVCALREKRNQARTIGRMKKFIVVVIVLALGLFGLTLGSSLLGSSIVKDTTASDPTKAEVSIQAGSSVLTDRQEHVVATANVQDDVPGASVLTMPFQELQRITQLNLELMPSGFHQSFSVQDVVKSPEHPVILVRTSKGDAISIGPQFVTLSATGMRMVCPLTSGAALRGTAAYQEEVSIEENDANASNGTSAEVTQPMSLVTATPILGSCKGVLFTVNMARVLSLHPSPEKNSAGMEEDNSRCKWSAWEPWTACSKTCGFGLRSRMRTSLVKEAACSNEAARQMTKTCNVLPCPDAGDFYQAPVPFFNANITVKLGCEDTMLSAVDIDVVAVGTPYSVICPKACSYPSKDSMQVSVRHGCELHSADTPICAAAVARMIGGDTKFRLLVTGPRDGLGSCKNTFVTEATEFWPYTFSVSAGCQPRHCEWGPWEESECRGICNENTGILTGMKTRTRTPANKAVCGGDPCNPIAASSQDHCVQLCDVTGLSNVTFSNGTNSSTRRLEKTNNCHQTCYTQDDEKEEPFCVDGSGEKWGLPLFEWEAKRYCPGFCVAETVLSRRHICKRFDGDGYDCQGCLRQMIQFGGNTKSRCDYHCHHCSNTAETALIEEGWEASSQSGGIASAQEGTCKATCFKGACYSKVQNLIKAEAVNIDVGPQQCSVSGHDFCLKCVMYDVPVICDADAGNDNKRRLKESHTNPAKFLISVNARKVCAQKASGNGNDGHTWNWGLSINCQASGRIEAPAGGCQRVQTREQCCQSYQVAHWYKNIVDDCVPAKVGERWDTVKSWPNHRRRRSAWPAGRDIICIARSGLAQCPTYKKDCVGKNPLIAMPCTEAQRDFVPGSGNNCPDNYEVITDEYTCQKAAAVNWWRTPMQPSNLVDPSDQDDRPAGCHYIWQQHAAEYGKQTKFKIRKNVYGKKNYITVYFNPKKNPSSSPGKAHVVCAAKGKQNGRRLTQKAGAKERTLALAEYYEGAKHMFDCSACGVADAADLPTPPSVELPRWWTVYWNDRFGTDFQESLMYCVHMALCGSPSSYSGMYPLFEMGRCTYLSYWDTILSDILTGAKEGSESAYKIIQLCMMSFQPFVSQTTPDGSLQHVQSANPLRRLTQSDDKNRHLASEQRELLEESVETALQVSMPEHIIISTVGKESKETRCAVMGEEVPPKRYVNDPNSKNLVELRFAKGACVVSCKDSTCTSALGSDDPIASMIVEWSPSTKTWAVKCITREGQAQECDDGGGRRLSPTHGAGSTAWRLNLLFKKFLLARR